MKWPSSYVQQEYIASAREDFSFPRPRVKLRVGISWAGESLCTRLFIWGPTHDPDHLNPYRVIAPSPTINAPTKQTGKVSGLRLSQFTLYKDYIHSVLYKIDTAAGAVGETDGYYYKSKGKKGNRTTREDSVQTRQISIEGKEKRGDD